MDYMLKRWSGFTTFLGDGRICLTNNAAERALRGFALGRKSWLFAGSDRGADRAAFMATLIMSAKLNDIDPQAWLADILANIADTPISRLEQLLPWNWILKALSAQARLALAITGYPNERITRLHYRNVEITAPRLAEMNATSEKFSIKLSVFSSTRVGYEVPRNLSVSLKSAGCF